MVGTSRARTDDVVGRATRSAPSARLVGVDLARGVAILGMLWVHLAADGGAIVAPAGRSAILFATLAGVSLGLLTGGANPPARGARWPSYRTIAIRGVLLIVLGRLLVMLGTPIAIILDYYGVLFLLLLVVLFARRWVLAVVGLAALTIGAWLIQAAGPDPGAAFTSRDPLEWPEQWLLTGLYPVALFAAYVVAGLIAARSDLTSRRTQLVMLAGGLVVAPLGYLAGALLGVDAGPHANTTWEAVGSGAIALAVIGALQLASASPLVRRVLSPVADIGSMPLTIYTAQVLVVAAYLAARPSADGSGARDWWLLAAVVGGSLVFAVAWRRLVGRGPLERLFAMLSRADRTIDGRPLGGRAGPASGIRPSTASRPLLVAGTALLAGAVGAGVVLALSFLFPAAGPSGAGPATQLRGDLEGAALFTFDPAVLQEADIELGGAGDGSSVELPILAGELEVYGGSVGGGLALDGSLSFRTGEREVLVEGLVVDLEAGTVAGDLSVDGSPVATDSLLFLALPRMPASATDSASSITVEGLTLTVTSGTARLLNESLGGEAFSAVAQLGTLDLSIAGP